MEARRIGRKLEVIEGREKRGVRKGAGREERRKWRNQEMEK